MQKLPLLVLTICAIMASNAAYAEELALPPFLPTWKLLRSDAKNQFIAGYLFGWRDAANVTDVAIDYVKQNPQNAVDGLERIRGIYDMNGVTSESIVRELDLYFSEADGREATLSQAITTVRMRLGR